MLLSGGSHGAFLTVNLAFGFAATLGILISGQVSGEGPLKWCIGTYREIIWGEWMVCLNSKFERIDLITNNTIVRLLVSVRFSRIHISAPHYYGRKQW